MENKATKNQAVKKDKKAIKKETPEKVSKTWLALMRGKKYGEIIDMKAVLK